MAENLSSDLDRAYEELRNIDSEIAGLSGRNQPDRGLKRKIVLDPALNSTHANFGGNERRVIETGGHRRIVVTAHNNSGKRSRFGHIGNDDEGEDVNYCRNSSNHYEPPPKRTLQSSVVMPIIETKSRAEILSEMKKLEKKEDTVRNQRLFSNLIVGTLKQFQKEEGNVKQRIQAQTEKQREIERRLEQTEKENRDRIMKEKRELMERRHEKEKEILRLKREKAILKYAEEKEKHFLRLQCFIQTQTKPPIFFLPAKHTLRTLELLKESAKKVQGLIAMSREKATSELQRGKATNNGGNVGGSDAESDAEQDTGIKSAVVAVPNVNEASLGTPE